jgi:hypothetical protein
VPSRLIGSTVLVRVRSETLEVFRATTMPRLLRHGQHRIDYRHVIWSLGRMHIPTADIHSNSCCD